MSNNTESNRAKKKQQKKKTPSLEMQPRLMQLRRDRLKALCGRVCRRAASYRMWSGSTGLHGTSGRSALGYGCCAAPCRACKSSRSQPPTKKDGHMATDRWGSNCISHPRFWSLPAATRVVMHVAAESCLDWVICGEKLRLPGK